MNSRREPAQSATSLDVSPEDDSRARVRNYLVTMAIRTACLILLVVIQPYGWHTAILAIGAIFLPYIAVVMANARATRRVTGATSPTAAAVEADAPAAEQTPGVLRVEETRAPETPEPDRDETDPEGDRRGETA